MERKDFIRYSLTSLRAAVMLPSFLISCAGEEAQGLCLFRYGSMNEKHWKYFLVR